MRLTVFNGSPRGAKGNTALLLQHFLEGFESVPGRSAEVHLLSREHLHDEQTQTFGEAEAILLAFPLYADAMPSMVKAFLEALAPRCGRSDNPPLAFLVQSGFPEACHSRPVQRYLEKLARRLGSRHLGTIVQGGVEGIRNRSPQSTRKTFEAYRSLGEGLARNGAFDAGTLERLSRPERMPAPARVILRLLVPTGLFDAAWNEQLRANGAMALRDRAPYA